MYKFFYSLPIICGFLCCLNTASSSILKRDQDKIIEIIKYMSSANDTQNKYLDSITTEVEFYDFTIKNYKIDKIKKNIEAIDCSLKKYNSYIEKIPLYENEESQDFLTNKDNYYLCIREYVLLTENIKNLITENQKSVDKKIDKLFAEVADYVKNFKDSQEEIDKKRIEKAKNLGFLFYDVGSSQSLYYGIEEEVLKMKTK